MSKPPSKDKFEDDGLRYKVKVSGSPFKAPTHLAATTMSCFLCGKHRPRAELKTRNFIGKSQAICAPSCKERDAV